MSEKSKQNNENQDESHISVCDILKTDTSKIIKKIESHTPALFQNYSNLYSQYLHVWDDLFGTCYISEKEFFDKINIDPIILKQIKENSEVYTNNFLEIIDMNAKFMDDYFKMRSFTIKSYDNFMHTMLETYDNCAHCLGGSKR